MSKLIWKHLECKWEEGGKRGEWKKWKKWKQRCFRHLSWYCQPDQRVKSVISPRLSNHPLISTMSAPHATLPIACPPSPAENPLRRKERIKRQTLKLYRKTNWETNEQSAFDRRSKNKNKEALNTLFEEKRKTQAQTLISAVSSWNRLPRIHGIVRHSLTRTRGHSPLFVGRGVAPTSVGVKMRLIYL